MGRKKKKIRGETWPSTSGWRTVWVFAMFDLPVETSEERKAYRDFRNALLDDGFRRVQYSIYSRYCGDPAHGEMHIRRMVSELPESGKVQFLVITDRQFGKMQNFYGKKRSSGPEIPEQIEFF